MPHAASSTADTYCLKCHRGAAGAGAVRHADRGNCVSCHPVATRGTYPRAVPHTAGDEAICLACHRDGVAGARVMRHASAAACLSCHTAATYGAWPPPVPHAARSADDASCRVCHGAVGHRDRSGCIVCHKV